MWAGKVTIRLMLAAAALAATVDMTRASTNTFTWGTSRYTHVKSPAKTWPDAEAACVSAGGHLAALETAEEHSAVMAHVGGDSNARPWIGCNDRTKEGSFVWTTNGKSCNRNSKESYSNWNPGEPNNVNNEDCAEVYSHVGGDRWNDLPCSRARAYLCENDLGSGDSSLGAELIQNGDFVDGENYWSEWSRSLLLRYRGAPIVIGGYACRAAGNCPSRANMQ